MKRTGRARRALRCGAGMALVLALGGCRTGAGGGTGSPATLAGLDATLWLQTAAEYHASALQAFRSALEHLDRALADPGWTAAVEQGGDFAGLPAAVILDMDEAIVRSDRFQAGLVASGDRFSDEAWDEWVRTETSESIPGALEYVRRVAERGVRIFYVTNRGIEVESQSLATLRKLGFPVERGEQDLLAQDERPDWGFDKSSRRAYLCRTHRIVQIVGDDLNDFTGGWRSTPESRIALVERYAAWWGARWIALPNPAYGSWERALYGFDERAPRDDVLRRKQRWLTPWR